MIPPAKELTDTEWYYILLLERLRGLSLRDIADLVGCSRFSIGDMAWSEFSEECPESLRYQGRTNRSLKDKVYDYMDDVFSQELVPLKPATLADVFGGSKEEVGALIERWRWDVSTQRYFPKCRECTFRGYPENPIMENGLCLSCNAKAHGWPLETWLETGQLTALFWEWGLLDATIVADYIKGNGRHDSRNCTEADRPEASQRERRMAISA